MQNDFISGSLAITGCPAGQDGEEVGQFLLNKIFQQLVFTHSALNQS